jgi:hypothetical protein
MIFFSIESHQNPGKRKGTFYLLSRVLVRCPGVDWAKVDCHIEPNGSFLCAWFDLGQSWWRINTWTGLEIYFYFKGLWMSHVRYVSQKPNLFRSISWQSILSACTYCNVELPSWIAECRGKFLFLCVECAPAAFDSNPVSSSLPQSNRWHKIPQAIANPNPQSQGRLFTIHDWGDLKEPIGSTSLN